MPEALQEGTLSDDHGIILWVDTIDPDAPDVATLNAATNVRLTYGITADGFNLERTDQDATISRYTMKQILTKRGTTQYKLTVTYVYNRGTPTVAEETLGKDAEGTAGYLVHVLGYENDHVFAADDKISHIIPVRITESSEGPRTANQELTKIVVPDITGLVREEVTVVA